MASVLACPTIGSMLVCPWPVLRVVQKESSSFRRELDGAIVSGSTVGDDDVGSNVGSRHPSGTTGGLLDSREGKRSGGLGWNVRRSVVSKRLVPLASGAGESSNVELLAGAKVLGGAELRAGSVLIPGAELVVGGGGAEIRTTVFLGGTRKGSARGCHMSGSAEGKAGIKGGG